MIDRSVDHNDFIDTTYNYTWNSSAGTVLVDMRYDYNKDGTSEIIHSASYNYNGHTLPQDKDKWTLAYEINYDSSGRAIRKLYANGDFIQAFYWDATPTSNKQYDVFFASSWTWQKTIEYYSNGIIMHYQFLPDPNPLTTGDDVRYEYDTQGRLVQTTLDTGDFIQTFYYGTTTQKQYDVFFTSSWTWQKSIEYYADGITRHFQSIADPNPTTTGDVVYEEYDTQGTCILKRYDDGSIWTSQSINNNTLAMAEQNKEPTAILDINIKQAKSYTAECIPIAPELAGQPENKGLPIQ